VEVEFGGNIAVGRCRRFLAQRANRLRRGGVFADESVPARTLSRLQVEFSLCERDFGLEKRVFIGAEYPEDPGYGRQTAKGWRGLGPGMRRNRAYKRHARDEVIGFHEHQGLLIDLMLVHLRRAFQRFFYSITNISELCGQSQGYMLTGFRDASRTVISVSKRKQSRNISYLGNFSQDEIRIESDVKNNDAILLVEDDTEIGALISRYLSAHQIEVVVVMNGKAMDVALADRAFDLLILDLNLPGEDGLSICRRVRAELALPIIIVTAQGEDVDRIVGLEVGADDYVVKPFNPRELLARIRSVLRRASGAVPSKNGADRGLYRFCGWSVDILARQVIAPSGVKVAMTGAEFDLLYALCEHPNRVLTRDQLINLTHGPTTGPFERSIDVLVSRLRQKLEADPKNPMLIQTVRAEGYMFTAQVARP
jgi:two-component system, OmpR family, response regulator